MLEQFKEIWIHDFEFHAPDGERPLVATLGAKELRSGRVVGLDCRQLGPKPPYDTGPENIFVSYYASAEIGCHLSLGWPGPANVIDLYAEFRNLTNRSNSVDKLQQPTQRAACSMLWPITGLPPWLRQKKTISAR